MTVTFADLTTMKVGGPADGFAVADSTSELLDVVRDADAGGVPLLVVGRGSNLVVSDAGFAGVTVQVRSNRMRVDGPLLTVDAGVEWDDVVAASLDAGLSGLEAMSGIPGSAGATPVQNVGAYGTLTEHVLESIDVYDRLTGHRSVWDAARCDFFSHRQSAFKHTDRFVVLSVTFRLERSARSRPVTFASLATALDVELGGTAPTATVRDTVLSLRQARGNIYDPQDPDTWGTGSFFINHVLPEAPRRLVDLGCPIYDDKLGVKIPAAWLIEKAGFQRGYGADFGRGTVGLSSLNTGAVCNRGDATTAEVMAFAAHVRDGVEREFGIRLGPECDLVGCSFDDPVTAALGQ